MSDRKPLMPKATAVWLVDNTSLTFEQIAEFCGLHVLEVKGIADGDVAAGIKGMDPISSGQLTREEIAKAEARSSHSLRLAETKVVVPPVKTKRGPRYTPVSRRQDRPNAVLWLLKNHPELKDSQIIRLVGTTKPTIAQIRDRTHWNAPNLVPQDPVTLGLCNQIDLDAEVAKSAKRAEAAGVPRPDSVAGTLLPTAETTGVAAPGAPQPDVDFPMSGSGTGDRAGQRVESEREETERIFAQLQQMSGPKAEDGDDQPHVEFETEGEGEAEAGEEVAELDSDHDDAAEAEADAGEQGRG